MSDSTLVVWDDVFTSYDFGPMHPMRPLRLELTMALSRQLGVLDRPGVTVGAPTPATDDLLELVHDPMYVASVKRAPDDLMGRLSLRYGLGTSDVPVFARMHESAALVTGATVDAARAVWTGTHQHAVNISGGLHHAMRDRASGFCVYDDPAVAIAWLLAQGATRVAYVDVDVHHGDGVEAAFYDDPRVLTVSIHESGRTLFPGTGWADQVGAGEGVGANVNLALPMGTGDAGWLRAFEAVVPQVLRAFAPQVILTQHGCDTHALDPLAHLMMSVDGQRVAYRRLHELAHELCGGKWIAVGGGGYEPVQVVPRAWTHLLAEVTGAPLDGATPDDWRDLARRIGDETAPTSLTDGRDAAFVPWEGGHGNADDPVDRAVLETREAVFPHLGLDALVVDGVSSAPTTADLTALRQHLVATRIAGDVATPRAENIRNAGRMVEGRVKYDFGLVPRRAWTTDEVMAVMARRCGTLADLTVRDGADSIDPDLTLAQLERWRERLAKAAAAGERVLLATGHPTGILVVHLQVAAALRAAGADVLVVDPPWSWEWPDPWGSSRPRHVRVINGVHVLASGGELLHTHEPEPVRAVLAVLDEPPDLVVADHGWAGAAAEAGIDTLAMADCNDPALFVAEEEGKPIVTVPLDDNVPPHLYDPLSDFVTAWD